MKIIKALFVATFALVVSYSVYSTQQNAEMSDLALANVEALAYYESTSGNCPDPYDVYDHQLAFRPETANFTIDSNMEIEIFGKKFKVAGGSVGANITVTYEIGHCNTYSPGNCCPNSRNGEIKIIGY